MISTTIYATLLATLLTTLPASASGPSDKTQTVVSFNGKPYPVSKLKKRIARQKGLSLEVEAPPILRGMVYTPIGEGPHPAIILVHDCRGIRDYQRTWAERLQDWGYLVLMLDSFTDRNIESTCNGLAEEENNRIRGGRVADIFAAHDYLISRNDVQRFRIGLMGWDYHSVLGAVARDGIQQLYETRFMGAVAIYPSCNSTSGTDFVTPLLVLVGEDDDWAPADECRVMEQSAAVGPEMLKVVYLEDAAHGFDDPEMGKGQYFPSFRNYFKSPANGVTMAYNEAADHHAQLKIRQFLNFEIKHRPIPMTLDDLPNQYTAEEIRRATYIQAPEEFGPNMPGKGASLFDRLFSSGNENNRHYNVPYPFNKLINVLERYTVKDTDSDTGLRAVLIPQGRSLVRDAAAPDFFKYPRIVVAVDREPPVIDGHYGPWLRDRLYIAYQEKAKALEVISYNPTLQRFEFQIVKDYAPGASPKVLYADRSLCVSCHQNHAPIFANAPWDETNFNSQVFSRISQVRDEFYGLIPAVPVASSANAIDRSSNRATVLPILNSIWREACGIPRDGREALTCRAAMVKAMIQYRLSNKTGLDRADTNLVRNFFNLAATSWRQRWPGGIAVMPSNITDRNPFTESMQVSARFDPLTPRLPEHIWYADNTGDLERVIMLLADQINSHDIATLDAALQPSMQGESFKKYASDCTITRVRRTPIRYLGDIECFDRERTELNNFSLRGTLDIDLETETVSGRFFSIERDAEFILYDLEFDSSEITPGARRVATFKVRHRRSDLAVRAPSGNSVLPFKLTIGIDDLKTLPDTFRVDLEFAIADDFKKVEEVLGDLLTAAIGDTKVNISDNAADDRLNSGNINAVARRERLFSSRPFVGNRYMAPILESLGIDSPVRDCCDNPFVGPPKATVDLAMQTGPVDIETASANELMLSVCGRCHRSGESFPPSFLSGNAEQIRRNIAICGERIAYRINMWNVDEGARLKTPMPPRLSLVGPTNLSREQWQRSGAIDRVSRYALADSELPGDIASQLAYVLSLPYDRLAECDGTLLLH